MYFMCLAVKNFKWRLGRKEERLIALSFAFSLYSQVVTAVTAEKVSLEPEAFRDPKVSRKNL